jgi:hypothetical protein
MAKFDTPLNIFDPKVYSAWLTKIQSYDLKNDDSSIKKMVSALCHGETFASKFALKVEERICCYDFQSMGL